MKILLIVAMALILSADARPQFKRRRGLMHVKRQDNSRACVRAANNLAELLEWHEIWDPTRYSEEVSFEEFMSVVSPIDITDTSERERFVCSLEGLTTVSEAVAAIDGLGSIEHGTSVVYAMMVANAKIRKVILSGYVQNPQAWMEEAYLEGMELTVQLITDLEASGFLSFEQNKVQMFEEWKMSMMPLSFGDYTPAAPSSLPLDQQCFVVANDARLLWNSGVKYGEQWSPGRGQLWREDIREWTGIELGSHGQMRGLICTVLEAVVNNGPHGLYQFLMDEGIIEQVATTGYPYLLQEVEMLKQQLDHMVNAPPDSYTNYYSYYGPSEPPTDGFTVLKDLLDNIEAMGLFSLAF